ncbi:hypothetical protein [Natronospora cellulosivora (SeqCode)]
MNLEKLNVDHHTDLYKSKHLNKISLSGYIKLSIAISLFLLILYLIRLDIEILAKNFLIGSNSLNGILVHIQLMLSIFI